MSHRKTDLGIPRRSKSAKVVLVREIIAKRIIEVARDGERDPDELCVRALKALGFSSFSNRQIV
jgi:hypothetical protein